MTGRTPAAASLGVRRLTARSAVLSLLLGVHPPQLPVRAIVRAAEVFGISDPTLRVALTRMVSTDELHRDAGTYRLSGRMLERQRRQDEALGLRTKMWRGGWETVVITAVGRSQSERTQLRSLLARQRFAELREGVWLRPDNLRRLAPATPELLTITGARPAGDPVELAGRLWDLDAWAATGTALLGRLEATRDDPGLRLATAAAIVRHLLTDPLLPPELTPGGWPGPTLRRSYVAYQRELIDLVTACRQGPSGRRP